MVLYQALGRRAPSTNSDNEVYHNARREWRVAGSRARHACGRGDASGDEGGAGAKISTGKPRAPPNQLASVRAQPPPRTLAPAPLQCLQLNITYAPVRRTDGPRQRQ